MASNTELFELFMLATQADRRGKNYVGWFNSKIKAYAETNGQMKTR